MRLIGVVSQTRLVGVLRFHDAGTRHSDYPVIHTGPVRPSGNRTGAAASWQLIAPETDRAAASVGLGRWRAGMDEQKTIEHHADLIYTHLKAATEGGQLYRQFKALREGGAGLYTKQFVDKTGIRSSVVVGIEQDQILPTDLQLQ